MAFIRAMRISAYIPCYNNESTLACAIASVHAQTVPVAELLVVDDGSLDRSVEVARRAGVRVVSLGRNLGRGAARARAMIESRGDLVLCCDATKSIEPDFVRKALPWFAEIDVAAVYGRMTQPPPRNAVERWRGRHLFKLEVKFPVDRRAPLITTGAVVRRSSVLGVGSFRGDLRHSEDAELGERLLAKGCEVVFDPGLLVFENAVNTLFQVLDRYWRYYAGPTERHDLRGYVRSMLYAMKVMARADLRASDPLSGAISLACPHYQYWRSWTNAAVRRLQRIRTPAGNGAFMGLTGRRCVSTGLTARGNGLISGR